VNTTIPCFSDGETRHLVSLLRAAVVPDPLVVAPLTSVAEAAGLMARARSQPHNDTAIADQASLNLQARASCVVVVDATQRVLGSFSSIDLVEQAATSPSLQSLAMEEVMVKTVLHLPAGESSELVEQLQELRQKGHP
jgi:CBS domain-containing protein